MTARQSGRTRPAASARAATPISTGGFDADAARARRRELLGEPFRFTWGGESFTLPQQTEWDVEVPDMMANGQMGEALRLLLDGQADRFFEVQRPLLGDIEAIISAAGQFFGVGKTAGE